MIDLHMWRTPNSGKIGIFLEETGLAYRIITVNITKGDQFKPAFQKLSPNGRMPAIVDPDGPEGKPISIFESGAILIYLANKTGRFLPSEPRAHYEVLQWVMFQMGNLGPMAGQTSHFRLYAPEAYPYAIARYTNEVTRLYGVLDRQLQSREFVAGDYSIADMAIMPWITPHRRHGQTIGDFPHLQRWYDMMKARPAVQRGLDAGKKEQEEANQGRQPMAEMSAETRSILFGDQQHGQR